MIKVVALTLASLPLLASQWYTATSLTFGAKSAAHLPSSFDARIEQYFIKDTMPSLYYKVGIFHEQLKVWDTEVDTAENILIGTGYNVFENKGIFLDLGVSAAYRLSYSAQTNETAYVEYDESAIIPYFEIATGYSFGQMTLRADVLIGMGLQGEAQIKESLTNEPLSNEVYTYDQVHVNFGLSYWW